MAMTHDRQKSADIVGGRYRPTKIGRVIEKNESSLQAQCTLQSGRYLQGGPKNGATDTFFGRFLSADNIGRLLLIVCHIDLFLLV